MIERCGWNTTLGLEHDLQKLPYAEVTIFPGCHEVGTHSNLPGKHVHCLNFLLLGIGCCSPGSIARTISCAHANHLPANGWVANGWSANGWALRKAPVTRPTTTRLVATSSNSEQPFASEAVNLDLAMVTCL